MTRLPPAILVIAVLMVSGNATGAQRAACPTAGHLGRVAYVDKPKVKWAQPDRGGSLRVLDLSSCRVRVIVRRSVQPPVRWSHDGRWIAFGTGTVVPVAGGSRLRPFGVARSWQWSPQADLLAGITQKGGVLIGGWRTTLRHLLPEGFGAATLAFDPSGKRLAVGRERPGELWIVDVKTASRTLVKRLSVAKYVGITVAGWSPHGQWVFYWAYPGASIAADGVPLEALPARGAASPRTVAGTLLYSDFMTWCGRSLVVAAGGYRGATLDKYLATASAPSWSARAIVPKQPRSWVSPACAPDGSTVAAAAGRNREEPRFGLEHRSLWLVSLGEGSRRLLTRPPTGSTDELPLWSRDGRSLLFVRTRNFNGTLYGVRLDGRLIGPLASVGWGQPYYGHYYWATQLDWFQPSTS